MVMLGEHTVPRSGDRRLTITNENAGSTKRSASLMWPPGSGRYATISPREIYGGRVRAEVRRVGTACTHHDAVANRSNGRVTEQETDGASALQGGSGTQEQTSTDDTTDTTSGNGEHGENVDEEDEGTYLIMAICLFLSCRLRVPSSCTGAI